MSLKEGLFPYPSARFVGRTHGKTRKEARARARPSCACRSRIVSDDSTQTTAMQKAKVDYGCFESNFDKKLSLPIGSPIPPMSPSILPVLPPPFKRKFGKFPKRFPSRYSMHSPPAIAGGPPAPPVSSASLLLLRPLREAFILHPPCKAPHQALRGTAARNRAGRTTSDRPGGNSAPRNEWQGGVSCS